MTTLVFSTVGTIYGGPVGGAIGSLVGRQVDAAILGTGNYEGPRLKELAASTSSYGQPIARHFGAMRVAGSIIWATDLVEHSETRGGGKGAPSVTTYSYTANLAVALASRPIMGIGRIWADGKLLRGADGDLKVGGTLRIHTGEGDQPSDPLIAANEGASRCPACRGLAYVVFEDLDLSEYYNRIPALTFEVLADEAFGLQDIVGELVDDVDAEIPLQGIAGFTSDGPLTDALETLGLVMDLDADAGGQQLVVGRERLQDGPVALPEAAISVDDGDFGGASGFLRQRARPSEKRVAAIRYFDTGRDYLPGVQHASGRPAPGEPRSIELPAALDAATARKLIERAARKIDWTRERISWRSCELDPLVAPGSQVTLPGIPGTWRVIAWEWQAAGVELSLERILPQGAATASALPADTGRASTAPDLAPARTSLVAFELPLDAQAANADAPRTCAAVSAESGNWSGAALYADQGDGELLPLGPSGRTRCVVGTSANALGPGSPLLFDRQNEIVITLVDPAMQLTPATMRQIASGANLALLGEEIIQFARAEALDDGAWRLTGLLRGLGGTGCGIAGHATGEPFALLDARLVPLDPAIVGTAPTREVLAIGRGDDAPVTAPVLLEGITLRPLPPVHPRRQTLNDGTLRLTWTRRARGNWQWQDGVDVPLVEQSESYVVTLGAIDEPVAMWNPAGPMLDIDAGLLSDLAATAPGAALHVRQQGTHALSEPLLLCNLP
jgi:hypothetical protein